MSKYSEIACIIKKEIEQGQFSSGKRLPTEYELVERFGVSRQTIRQAIASLKNDGTVYQVQGSGTYVSDLRKDQKGVISSFRNVFVLCTYISEYIFPSIVRGIESTLNGTGYRFNLAATGNKVETERKILKDVIKLKECDGMIVEGSKTGLPNPNIALYKELEDMGIPVVFLHCSYNEIPDSVVVGMDDREGGRIAAGKLIDAGCKKILGIFKADDKQGILRYAGFSDKVVESDFGLDNVEIRWYTTEDIQDHGMTIDNGMIKLLVEKGFDGIVCYNDLVASAIVRDFTRVGQKIPKIISFDRSFLSENSHIKYESLGHRKDELGVVAATKLKNMIDGKKETSQFFSWLE